jgi:hypothetical protein
MLKFFMAVFIVFNTFSAWAGLAEQSLPIKERLRISLWVEGIEHKASKEKISQRTPVILPEEIERPLRKL